MSEQLGRTELGDIAIRDDAEGDGRTIEGLAVPYNVETIAGATREYGAYREAFDPGAFAAAIAARAGRPTPIVDGHDGTVVGGAELVETPEGVRFRGRLLTSQAARDFAERVAAGLVRPSVEFLIGETYRKGDTVRHRTARGIAAIAGVYKPAYGDAVSAAVRSQQGGSQTMPEIIETPAEPAEPVATRDLAGAIGPAMSTEGMRSLMHEVAIEAYRAIAERGGLGADSEPHPMADLFGYRSLGALVTAAGEPGASLELRSYVARSLAYRALDDTVTTAGANAGLLEGALTVAEVKRIVNAGRPAITAFGGPAPIAEGTGMNLAWPYFDGTLTDFVGAQSAEKAEITSASMDIKLATEAIVTYAGGTDMSYQLIRRGSPSALEAWARIVLAAWAYVTDAAFVTELESGSVTLDTAEAVTSVDYAELVGLLVTGSIAVQTATGVPAEFVLAGTTAFTQFAKLVLGQNSTPVSSPIADIRGLSVSVGNVPIIHVPSLTAGKSIVSNRLAARWHEEGPFQASAEDVAKLGRNVAYWSMGAGARYIPAGIIELYDVTP